MGKNIIIERLIWKTRNLKMIELIKINRIIFDNFPNKKINTFEKGQSKPFF